MQHDTLACGGIWGCLAGRAMIDMGKPDATAGRILDIGGKTVHRGTVADIGWCNMQGKKAAKCVQDHIHL